ncbi:hypothetical protein [Streptomyces flavofungini]|uniref:Uncharacterized protein n=1 Tax=Streptomyces flavofungini TaxID=68200 RepID=A0ABS0XB61_9ACTN|nr:hypothetical protein [Streptomyces flavofungini]MBJ3810384.1 hypothetical protein [Streptomyces flavofungini]GHC42350.1 hypothetical protein GCM10010349_03110 [Streptomyces flavofungini]
MEHISAAEALTVAAHAAEKQGAGNLLRVVLIVMVVGCVLVAWLLLRGYRQGNAQEPGDGSRDAGGGSGNAGDGAVGSGNAGDGAVGSGNAEAGSRDGEDGSRGGEERQGAAADGRDA